MRQPLIGISIALAFVVGCLAASHVPALGVPAASAYQGTQWDYECTEWPSMGLNASRNAASLTQRLDDMGGRGWELAPVPTEGGTFLCFKRPR